MPLMGPILSFGCFSPAALLTLVAAAVIGAFWVGWGLLLAPARGNKDAARAPMERGHKNEGSALAETASVPAGTEEDAGTGSMAPSPVRAVEDGKEEDSGAVAVGYCASTAMDGERKVYEFEEQVVGDLALVDGNARVLPDVPHHLAEREDEDGCCAQIPLVPAAKEKNGGKLSDSETVPPPAASVEDKDHPLPAEHCAPPSALERETGLHDDNILEEVGAALPLGGEEERAPEHIVAPSVPVRHQEDKEEGSALVETVSVHNANQNKDALTGTAAPPLPREEDGKDLCEVGEEVNKDHHVAEQVDVAVVAREKTDVPPEEAPLTTAVNVNKADGTTGSKAADKPQIGELTLEELKAYDGSDAERPLLLAIKGNIYDVSTSRQLYGPGGHYELFGGRDVTRALALMSFEPEDLTGKIDDLKKADLEVLGDWEQKFMEKYPRVGCLIAIESDDAKKHP